MSKMKLHIVHLYPKEMNIYGDTGNTLILRRRLEWRGIETNVTLVGIGDTIPEDADIILGGGGQDAGQEKIQSDLKVKAPKLKKMAEEGVVMLMVCGMYQLFGRSFTTSEGIRIEGIGVLPLETVAGSTRHIGNTLYNSDFGAIVGYENHSGITTLDNVSHAFATTEIGAGNNAADTTEGCLLHNVFGTYSHGPLLSKNPHIADELIRRALQRKYPDYVLTQLDDELETLAFKFAKERSR